MLPTSAFDSKQKFLTVLRQEFEGGTFELFSGCKNKFINAYYKHLKQDFEAGEQGHCLILNHIGHQGNGYWCISDQVFKSLFSVTVLFISL